MGVGFSSQILRNTDAKILLPQGDWCDSFYQFEWKLYDQELDPGNV